MLKTICGGVSFKDDGNPTIELDDTDIDTGRHFYLVQQNHGEREYSSDDEDIPLCELANRIGASKCH